MSRQQLAALALAATTLAASGCGGSSKSSSQTTSTAQVGATAQTGSTANAKPITQAELTAAANAICGRIRARLAQNKFTTQQEIGRAAPGIAAYERSSLVELEKLVPPPSLAGDWAQIVAGIRTLASDAAKIGEYERANRLETPAGHAFLLTTGIHGKFAASIAKRDGIDRCAEAI
ncbi:MAG: hypothetical protein WA484_04825 [Solirubrobacteraceae bacterium]